MLSVPVLNCQSGAVDVLTGAFLRCQAAVKASLTNCVGKEQDKSTRKKMADTTGEVASMVMENDTEQWPEMFPFLFTSAKVCPSSARVCV